jgi:hypothetical protein
VKTIATGFEPKPAKTVRVVLRPNHSQTINLGFEAQPRNSRSSSPRAWCRSHKAPPDLLIARPPSIRPMRPSRSSAPGLLILPRSSSLHTAPSTCTPRDKQTRFSKRNKGKRKIKQNYPGFKFKPRRVNDLSQSNQVTDHLISQSPP